MEKSKSDKKKHKSIFKKNYSIDIFHSQHKDGNGYQYKAQINVKKNKAK